MHKTTQNLDEVSSIISQLNSQDMKKGKSGFANLCRGNTKQSTDVVKLGELLF